MENGYKEIEKSEGERNELASLTSKIYSKFPKVFMKRILLLKKVEIVPFNEELLPTNEYFA